MTSLEEKLVALRKKWLVASDPVGRKIIEAQAKLLKMAAEKGENIIEQAKKIFKGGIKEK